MKVFEANIKDIKPYENNPRKIPAEAVEKVANSIREFGMQQPIVVDKDMVIIVGHTRFKACQSLRMGTVPCVIAENLTEEQTRAYRLADNKTNEFTSWDNDLMDFELGIIADIDMEQFGFESKIEDPYEDGDDMKGNLNERYGISPFSILDTRQAYWQERKRSWLEITGNLSETRDGEFGTLGNSGGDNLLAKINGGTSNFDPFLAELMYKWFNIPGGRIIDPFGGEQTKGVVAGSLGYPYTAIEIRQDQVDLNKAKTSSYEGVNYICGDSNDISKLCTERGFDMCFTSPPYYDLEVYSKSDMSALGSYEEFMASYENIFRQCYEMMADNRFLVIKVGEIRNKQTGEYRAFVADNIEMFKRIGFKFYNDIVLINSFGTAPIRANNSMKTRKVVHVHQNVLVFYKGDLSKISSIYPTLYFAEDETEDENT